MPTKVVINTDFGGFSLSERAMKILGTSSPYRNTAIIEGDDDWKRDDPRLVAVVERLGSEAASGTHARLAIVEIPDDVGDNWHISDYDGQESVHENHRSW